MGSLQSRVLTLTEAPQPRWTLETEAQNRGNHCTTDEDHHSLDAKQIGLQLQVHARRRISKRSGPGPAWELLNAWVALMPSYADLNRLAVWRSLAYSGDL